MKIAFHPEEIVKLIIKMIRSQETRSIVGCVAWLSHKDILKALTLKPCRIVVARDRANARKHVKSMYAALTPAKMGNRAIKFLGSRSGRQKYLLHHKFLVAIDSEGVARAVISGSFNFSQNALNNLENITYIRDSDVAQSYFEEFNRIWDIC
jgi:phosphatidylserine/phosphatidylglycerophosphate/cardiolipin synthase-like enzyme